MKKQDIDCIVEGLIEAAGSRDFQDIIAHEIGHAFLHDDSGLFRYQRSYSLCY